MDDICRTLIDAWTKIRPRLARDERELRRRLLRRRQALLQSPPRAWCIALRAADRRIPDDTRVPVDPTTLAATSFSPPRPLAPSPAHLPHQLTLDSTDLRELIAPIELHRPGEPVALVAERLGTTPAGLLNARLKNRFRTHHTPTLNGHWGKPHPMLYTEQQLDPQSRGFPPPDPLWSVTSRLIGSRIPEKIRATLIRVPVFYDATRAYRDKSDLHPEHPDVDKTFDTRPKKRNYKLPPPEPDFVPYKWKGDQFVGYDWRAAETNPLIKENYQRFQRQRQLARAAAKRPRRENPRPSHSQGSLKFRGWRWLCPHCNRAVNVLFYPLPRLHLLPGKIPRLPRDEMKKLNLPHPRNEYFACQKCHRVRRFSSLNKGTWGEIVCYLSAGLLYGNEVKRPAWFVPQRKNTYAPKINREPSQRRPQIERLLLAGRTIKQTADELALSQRTILFYARQIYHRHGVRCLKELLIKHGVPTRPGMRGPGLGPYGAGPVLRRRRAHQPIGSSR